LRLAGILLSLVVAMANKGLLAVVLAFSSVACSHDQGALGVGLANDPTTWQFRSHNIAIGWMLELQVAIDERGGVPIQLDRVQFTALDRGTSQAFNFFLMQKEDLDRDASSSIPAHGRIVLQPSLGLVTDRPTGPVAVLVEVFGTDREGNAVTATLNRDYPLCN
jgi:hypothetical protein